MNLANREANFLFSSHTGKELGDINDSTFTAPVIQIPQLLTIRTGMNLECRIQKICPMLDKGFPDVTIIFCLAQINEKKQQRQETDCLRKDQMEMK